MAVTANAYPQTFVTLFNKEANWTSDTIKVALATGSYTFASTHKYFDASPFNAAFTELSNGVASNGITTAGYTAGGATFTGPTTAVSGAGSPFTFTYSGAATTTWTSVTFSVQYAVIYDSTPGAGVKPLLGYINFGAFQTVQGGNFQISWNASGVMTISVP